jgi:hypothetical protein
MASKETQPEDRMLKWFDLEGIHGPERYIRSQFQLTATTLVTSLEPGPERTVALRKLLEAQEAAVRAKLHPGG